MNAISRGLVLAACGILAAIPPARGDEVPLKASEMPAAVMDSLKLHYPGAEFLGFSRETEDGATRFEAEMKTGERHVDVSLDSAGVVREVESEVALDELPTAVREALAKSDYARGRVTLAERHTEPLTDRAPVYELHIDLKKKRYEVVFQADGRMVRHDRADGED